MQSTRVAILGVDVGGTFTDAVLLDGGRMRTAKVPTALRQEESVLAAARAVGVEGVTRFAHGTTTAVWVGASIVLLGAVAAGLIPRRRISYETATATA